MFRDLRTQLLLWTILPLGAILIVVAYFGVNSHQTAMREMVAERDGVVARVAAAQWSETLALHARLLPTLDPGLPAQCDTSCAAFDGGIASFDAQGNLLHAQPSADVWQNRRAHVASLLNRREVSFAPPFVENNVTRVLVAVPQSGNILIGAFAPPPLTNLGFGAHGIAYLVDARGKIIAHPNAARLGEDMSRHAGITQVMRGETGATYHHADTGAEIVVGYAPIAPMNWGLIVEEPWEEIVAPMFQYAVLLPLLLSLAAVVALGAVYFGVRNVVRPLQNLAQAANRIAYGDYRAAERPVGGVGEIEALRETLDAMARQVSAAQDAMQNYITAMTRGQEDERVRLARELHDETIQSLIALQQRIEMVEKALGRDTASAAGKIKELRELVGTALVSVRRFVRDLRPTYLEELGLIPALEMLARESHATFEVTGEETRLDAERELALYRIVQEALRNVAKHAQAKHVAVTLSFDAHEVAATIEDDGVGFVAPDAPTAYAPAGHFGLMGMQERAQLFGGNVYVKSEHGKGTKVVAFVPVSAIVQ
ncbi:MAG: HAMP domain-containing protein [Chloroflexi bacterium]|nr:HAMP domain-containing protein [Chloroflexota bacterium]